MNREDTDSVKAIPPHRLREIEKKNRLGKSFMFGSVPLFGLFGWVVVKAETITLAATFLLLIAVFVLMVGANLYSNQYVKGAVEAALGTVKRLGSFRK